MPGVSAESMLELEARVAGRIVDEGGWLRFDDFMRIALYEPGLGYYSGPARKFGRQAGDGSDFITAPEMSPMFGWALARQIGQVLSASAPAVLEFGAGSGRLAADLLLALADNCHEYLIVELSGSLREVQRATLLQSAPQHAGKVRWLDEWPREFSGCVIGNELLDAMPVRLIEKGDDGWLERGVVRTGSRWPDGSTSHSPRAPGAAPAFCFATVPAPPSLQALIAERLPDADRLPLGYQTELAEEAPAMVATLAGVLRQGAAIFLDYGFPQAEYYHPQRSRGTLMCHQGHLSDTDPLVEIGRKDITAHVDFTAVALAGQEAGMDVAGYTSQARFLMNCGLVDLLEGADRQARVSAQTLIMEHEMGELFKVLGFVKGLDMKTFEMLGFRAGDRSHTL